MIGEASFAIEEKIAGRTLSIRAIASMKVIHTSGGQTSGTMFFVRMAAMLPLMIIALVAVTAHIAPVPKSMEIGNDIIIVIFQQKKQFFLP